tara:strand:- start:3429 stop:4229 length:801 start_codon:yes stop_codon:yes gene_type:complete
MNFFYFSNNEKIVKILDPIEQIDTVFIDLEINGKRSRQPNKNSLISNHKFEDITNVKNNISNTALGVRINPFDINSEYEINECIRRGADIIMLPMFKDEKEVIECLDLIDGRCKLDLLFETPKSLDNISKFPLDKIRFIHFGINDLSIAYNYKNMFECLISGILEKPINYLNSKKITFGIGGIGAYDTKPISPKLIIEMHKYYSSSRIILSRSFLKKLDLNESRKAQLSNKNEIKQIIDLIKSIMKRNYIDSKEVKVNLKKALSNI